jgi:O-methyltransferase
VVNMASASQRMIEYKPGLVGKTARIVIPVLQSVLPSAAFKSAYDGLYWLNKRRIWAGYALRSLIALPFSTSEIRLKQTLTRQLLPYTMGGPKALENAFDLAALMQANKVDGDIVECGVAQGGTAAMLALASDATGSRRRHFWYFDSFEGLPEPTEEDYKGTSAGQYVQPLVKGSCLGTVEQVSELLFDKLGIAKERVTLVKGWFQDTVFPNRDRIGSIAILRLDGDWYESTKIPLEGFYDKISPGGAVIIDDYATCYGSEKAVEEFLAGRNITVDLRPDGRGGAWFIKPH